MLWELNQNLNLNLNLLTYMRLGSACTNFFQSLPRGRTTTGASLNIGNFLLGFKKGSISIRKIFTKRSLIKKPVETRTQSKTFFRLISEPVGDPATIRRLFSDWGGSFLPNIVREFMIKFSSNILGLNVRLSHFVDNATRNCTFCYLQNRQIFNDETFYIFFLPATPLTDF